MHSQSWDHVFAGRVLRNVVRENALICFVQSVSRDVISSAVIFTRQRLDFRPATFCGIGFTVPWGNEVF
jgi:hypothetical protein